MQRTGACFSHISVRLFRILHSSDDEASRDESCSHKNSPNGAFDPVVDQIEDGRDCHEGTSEQQEDSGGDKESGIKRVSH